MGEFALGFIPIEYKARVEQISGRSLQSTDEHVLIIEGEQFTSLLDADDEGCFFEKVDWAGYTCVRDATTSSLADVARTEPLPEWKQMIEVRYGLSPNFRRRGVITRAQSITMRWAVEEQGVKRFIAESQKHNVKSASVLQRLGLKVTDTSYFHEESALAWASNSSPT